MSAEPHSLSLTSARVNQATRTTLYRAECSCGRWSISRHDAKPAAEVRALHMLHLQDHLGPDAQARRLDGTE